MSRSKLVALLIWLMLFIFSGIWLWLNLFPRNGQLVLKTDFIRPAKFLFVPKIGDWALALTANRFQPVRQLVVGTNVYVDLTIPRVYERVQIRLNYLGRPNSFKIGIYDQDLIFWLGKTDITNVILAKNFYRADQRYRFIFQTDQKLPRNELIDATFILSN